MRPFAIQFLRVLSCTILIGLVSMNWAWWWVAAVPWAILCWLGITLAIPLWILAIIAIGISAGGAQADWMSDGFVIGLAIVTPTILAMAAAEYLRRRRAR